MNWMFLPLKRYADFQGRSRRMEYWMFALLQAIIACVFYALILSMMGGAAAVADPEAAEQEMSAAIAGGGSMLFLVFGLIWLALFIPALAVTVRRLHDQDKSGWFVLLPLIPFVGGIILFVFMLLPGTPGDNQYGPDPLAGEGY